MRWPFSNLRKSYSVQDAHPASDPTQRKRSFEFLRGRFSLHKNKSACNETLHSTLPPAGGSSQNGHLSSPVAGRSYGYRLGGGYRASNIGSEVGTKSACCGEESRFDPELDKSMMQTINDVKYENRRPKFTAVGEYWTIIRPVKA